VVNRSDNNFNDGRSAQGRGGTIANTVGNGSENVATGTCDRVKVRSTVGLSSGRRSVVNRVRAHSHNITSIDGVNLSRNDRVKTSSESRRNATEIRLLSLRVRARDRDWRISDRAERIRSR
jgi:hypothetical protein